MGDWATYSPADLVYVSPAAWARLFERYHEALWPAQIAGGIAGLVLLTTAGWRQGWRHGWRVALLLAALAWAVVGTVFHGRWHAELNWAAPAIGGLWLVQAALLAGAAFAPGGWVMHRMRRVAGLVLLALPALLGPWLPRAEVVGLTPDATTLATIGLLLAGRPSARWLAALLWPLPLAAAAMALLLRWPGMTAQAVVDAVAASTRSIASSSRFRSSGLVR